MTVRIERLKAILEFMEQITEADKRNYANMSDEELDKHIQESLNRLENIAEVRRRRNEIH